MDIQPAAVRSGLASANRRLPGHVDVRAALLGWAEDGWRELPWRRTRDPWAVLVSELMLQQTQVARVIPKWTDFLARWPTPAACAAAPVADVVRAWAGLGYNRRALNLHRCAVLVTRDHRGVLPRDVAALQRLPGIGPYTARAVMAFAFDADVGVLDTNAARVLARAVAGRPLRRAEAQALADSMVPAGQGWVWNQAMLDLGATMCTARQPRCGSCPLADVCAWRRLGDASGGSGAAGRSGVGAVEDPAVGSAGVSTRQSRFDGSDRQGRGRLLDALRAGPVLVVDVAAACGWPDQPARAAAVAAGLIRDGFTLEVGAELVLA